MDEWEVRGRQEVKRRQSMSLAAAKVQTGLVIVKRIPFRRSLPTATVAQSRTPRSLADIPDVDVDGSRRNNYNRSKHTIYKATQPPQNIYCSLTNTAAIPIPEPIHMLVTNTFPPVCFATDSPVAICREPAARRER